MDVDAALKEHFDKLPDVVQQAIVGANVPQLLQRLSGQYKLHFDQWKILEDEVTMALLGLEDVTRLEENIKHEVGVEDSVAHSITERVMTEIFEPIRAELERQLDHPDAQPKEGTLIEDMTAQILKSARPQVEPPEATPVPMDTKNETPAPATSTPVLPENPPQKQTEKSGPTSGAYAPGQTSAARKEIHDDPYREPAE